MRAFESVAAEGRMPLSMLEGKRARQVWALVVSGNYFSTLRATPAIGRVFTDADRTSTDVPAIVSARFWSRAWRRPSVAGRTLTLNGRIVSIVGVLPDGFQGPGGLYEPDSGFPRPAASAEHASSAPRTRRAVVDRRRTGGAGRDGGAGGRGSAGRRDRTGRRASRSATRQRTLVFAPMVDGNPEVRSLAPYAWIGTRHRRPGAPHRLLQRRGAAPGARVRIASARSACARRSARAARASSASSRSKDCSWLS